MIKVLLLLMMMMIMIVMMMIPIESFQLNHHHHHHHHRHRHHHHHSSIYYMKSNDIDTDSSNIDATTNDTNDTNDTNNTMINMKGEYILAFIIIPLLSLLIPLLLSLVIDNSIPLNTRNTYIIMLLLFKRIYLYLIAITSVSIVAKRSLSLPSGLGQRLSIINTEALGINIDDLYTDQTNQTATNTTTTTSDNILINLARMERESNTEIYESLDQIKDNTQAILLPGIISLSLLVSFTYLTLTGVSNPSDNNIISPDIVNMIKSNINSIVVLANVAVCIVFSNIEIKNAITTFIQGNNDSNDRNKNSNIISSPAFSFSLALALSALAVLLGTGSSVWPLQNVINMCISITVARALQFNKLPTIILALIGLVIYDYVSVVGLQQFTDGGMSIMEAVARSKFESGGPIAGGVPIAGGGSIASSVGSTVESVANTVRKWQPGLFEIVVDKKVSDVLGLADIVFPSTLAGWAYRFDNANKDNDNDISIFSSSLVGYVFGCLLLEVFQTGSGQPALIYLVPSMLSSIFVAGLFNKKLQKMWNYENKN